MFKDRKLPAMPSLGFLTILVLISYISPAGGGVSSSPIAGHSGTPHEIPARGRGEEVAAISRVVGDSDWPLLMHDLSHSGYTDQTLVSVPPTGELNVKWKVGLGERVEMEVQPIVAYDHVYMGVMNGKFYAIDVATGQIAWVFQAGGAIAHTAAADGGRVYFGCEDGKVYALDALAGSLVWSYTTGGPVLSSPAIVDDIVLVGSFDKHLYALDGATGHLRWRFQTGGRVWTSPAVDIQHRRVYFGSEDMYAYCVHVDSGELLWKKRLSGVSMRNTYPVLSAGIVIFTTVKPGVESYAPAGDEDYPFPDPRNPVEVWNEFYEEHPERRPLYFLDAATGDDKWDPAHNRYTPLPIPYWGLLNPLVDPQGYAWLPASGGGGDHALDHDDRLWKVDLSTGVYREAGSAEEYLMRFDETGRHTMGDGKYYVTIAPNVGLYDPVTRQRYHLFGPGFSSDIWVIDPMPTENGNRYSGTGWSFGGVGTSSPLVIADGMGFFVYNAWLYALTPESVAEPGVINLGMSHMSGPPPAGMTYERAVDEINWRVQQIIAAGHLEPQPVFWGWDKANLHGFWREGETITSLARTMPYLRPNMQAALRAYLRAEAATYLFGQSYEYDFKCMVYGQDGLVSPCDPADYEGEIYFYWCTDDLNVIAENLHAMWAYAHYTGDWQTIDNHWGLITELYHRLTGAFDDELGLYIDKRWHTPDMILNGQIRAMLAVSRMAEQTGDTATATEASDFLAQMYETRLRFGRKVQTLYDQGVLHRVDDPDELEPFEIMPYQGYRDRDTDVRQVQWWDHDRVEIVSFPADTHRAGSGVFVTGVQHYEDLTQYRPMFPELAKFLGNNLRAETEQYIQTVTERNPWWYWCDATHAMQYGGENLYNQAHISAAIFQAKAYVLGESFDVLKDYLPWTYANAGFRDIYRLQNLVALLSAPPSWGKSVIPKAAQYADVLTYTISLIGTGQALTVTDDIPAGVAYREGTARVAPEAGSLVTDANHLQWTGVLSRHAPLEIAFETTVVTTEPTAIVNTAKVNDGSQIYDFTAMIIVNGYGVYLPLIYKDCWY